MAFHASSNGANRRSMFAWQQSPCTGAYVSRRNAAAWQSTQTLDSMQALRGIRAVCFDWGGTLMSELRVGEELRLPVTSLAMIGDSFQQDYEAPTSFGVQAVWFDPAGQARGVRSVSDLREFARMVLNAI